MELNRISAHLNIFFYTSCEFNSDSFTCLTQPCKSYYSISSRLVFSIRIRVIAVLSIYKIQLASFSAYKCPWGKVHPVWWRQHAIFKGTYIAGGKLQCMHSLHNCYVIHHCCTIAYVWKEGFCNRAKYCQYCTQWISAECFVSGFLCFNSDI